jgi:predicted transcriptional regulator
MLSSVIYGAYILLNSKNIYTLSTLWLITINKMGTKEKILSLLIRENNKTVSDIAENLNFSRQAVWKILTKLIDENLINSKSLNSKQTSAKIFYLNFKNPLIKKVLSLILTKQSLNYERWRDIFSILEKYTSFILLFGSIINNSKNANDIDILIISIKENFQKIEEIIFEIQKVQIKKIHYILLTEKEFKDEIKSLNKAYLDSIKKGIVLYGQENFVNQMEELHGH